LLASRKAEDDEDGDDFKDVQGVYNPVEFANL
jgi:hypothetical protein